MRNYFRLRIVYITVLIGLITPPILSTDNKHEWDAISNITYPICNSFKCHCRARYLEDSVDTSVNPCHDFYEYACGGWMKKHPMPTTELEYSIETYLKMITTKRVEYLLKQDDTPTEEKAVRTARKLYRECMRRHKLGRIDVEAIKSHLSKQGFWPLCSAPKHDVGMSKSWVRILQYYSELSNDSPFVNINIGLDKKKDPVIKIEELSKPFVMLDVVKWNEEKKELYIKFLNEMIKSLKIFKFPSCKIDERIREVVRFRQKLDEVLKFISETSAKGTKTKYMFTIKQFQTWYDLKTGNLGSITRIPWLDILRAVYPSINGVKVDEKTVIIVRNKEYFELLGKVLDATPLRVIVNHINLYFVEGHLKMDSKLLKLLKAVIYNDDTFYDELIMDNDKFHICILNHPMRGTIANMYNDVFLTEDIEKDVFNIAKDVKDMLKLQMTESKWLHHSIKFLFVNKLIRTSTYIGTRDVIDQNSERSPLQNNTEWIIKMTPSILPEAAYVVQNEHVLIGTGYLQQPVYDEAMPYTINYGSLGPLLGHEFFHSFQSSLSANVPVATKMGTELEMSKIYTKKAKCFHEQYGQFGVKKELNTLPSSYYVKPDPVQTADENIADTMGLKAAYAAYRRKLWLKKGECPTVMSNLKLSCDQLFFVSFAHTFCGNYPPMEIRKMLKRSMHLPPRLRVNGATSNLKAFDNAFHCSKRHLYSSKKRCNIWK